MGLGSEIRDPGSRVKKAPDPGPRNWIRNTVRNLYFNTMANLEFQILKLFLFTYYVLRKSLQASRNNSDKKTRNLQLIIWIRWCGTYENLASVRADDLTGRALMAELCCAQKATKNRRFSLHRIIVFQKKIRVSLICKERKKSCGNGTLCFILLIF